MYKEYLKSITIIIYLQIWQKDDTITHFETVSNLTAMEVYTYHLFLITYFYTIYNITKKAEPLWSSPNFSWRLKSKYLLHHLAQVIVLKWSNLINVVEECIAVRVMFWNADATVTASFVSVFWVINTWKSSDWTSFC